MQYITNVLDRMNCNSHLTLNRTMLKSSDKVSITSSERSSELRPNKLLDIQYLLNNVGQPCLKPRVLRLTFGRDVYTTCILTEINTV